jgi:hypothetical protein
MNDSAETLQSSYRKLEEAIKIKSKSPMFRIKLTLRAGAKKLREFSALLRGKVSKDQTKQHITAASSTGDFAVIKGHTPNTHDMLHRPQRNAGPHTMPSVKSPHTVNFDPNLSKL